MILFEIARRDHVTKIISRFRHFSRVIFHTSAASGPWSAIANSPGMTSKPRTIDGSPNGARRAWGRGSRVLNCEWSDTRLRVDLVKETKKKKTFKYICCPIYVYLFVSSPGVARRRARAEDTVPRDSHEHCGFSFSKTLLYLFRVAADSRANPCSMKNAEFRRGTRISNVSAN